MTATIRPRGGTAAAWTAANPVLAVRELGVETDTGRIKIGDGAKTWTALPYSTGGLDNAAVKAVIGSTVVQGDNISVAVDPTTGNVTISAEAPGIQEVGYTELPAGMIISQPINSNGTFTRPTTRGDLIIEFVGGPTDPTPPSVTPPATNGAWAASATVRGDRFTRRTA